MPTVQKLIVRAVWSKCSKAFQIYELNLVLRFPKPQSILMCTEDKELSLLYQCSHAGIHETYPPLQLWESVPLFSICIFIAPSIV